MAVITIPGMFLTGDHASRPAANAVGAGSLYSCATHSLVYQSDGSSWSTWATLGSTSTADHNHTAAGGDGGDLDSPVIDGYAVFNEESAPSAADAGTVRVYAKSDGRIYSKDDAGTEYGPFDAAGAGTGDLPGYGVNWMQYPIRLGLIGGTVAAHVQNPLQASDDNGGTSANSTTVTVPQDHRVDLGAEREVASAYVVYSSSSNRSDDGELQYSNDGSSWTAAATWTNDTSTSRLHTFTPVTARYWRIYTTQTGSPGGAGVNVAEFRLYSPGTDYAAGLTPTFGQSTNNATNATDRDPSTSANATTGSMPQTCRVDLGAAETVHAVRVVFSSYSNMAGTLKVQWSSDDSNWNDIGDPMVFVSQPECRFDFAGQSARYWRANAASAYISGNGLNWTTFEVWGE
jgi:hypothetical protein